MLNPEKIRTHLGEKYNQLPITVFDTIDSTNTQAKQSSLNRGIFAARHQSAGRGRQGKSFYSPADTGLYMSVILPITPMEAYDFSVTAAAAVAVARAVYTVCGINLQIKWVNDLYLNGKKIVGILTEACNDRVVVGIGINITTSDFPSDIPLAGSLGSNFISPSILCAEITKNLYEIISDKNRDFMKDYRDLSMLLGNIIKFEKDGKTFYAKALRIEDNGNLTVLLDSRELSLTGGEVHLIM